MCSLLSAATLALVAAGCGDPRMQLRYAAPNECVAVYRVTVDEQFANVGYANFYNRAEEHSRSWLGIAAAPATPGETASGPQLRAQLRPEVRFISDDAGVKAMRDPRVRAHELSRAWTGGPLAPGPAAPDAACRDRSWDPLEDALSLAFPRLPSQRVARGDTWTGAEVRGDGTTCSARDACCNLGACLDAEHQRDRSLPCVVGPWRETLIAATEPDAAQGLLRIEGRWSDGRAGGEGAVARREVDFDLARGRVLRAQITLSHPFLGLTRAIEVQAIDDCGDLAAPALSAEDLAGLARMRTAFEYKQPAGKSQPR